MDIIGAIIGSGALSAVIGGLFSLIRRRDATQKCLRQMLYNDIKTLGRKYIAADQISSEDLEDLIDMHKIYHDDLSGNGYLDHVMEEVKKLKVVI